jgi:hypothetical protein
MSWHAMPLACLPRTRRGQACGRATTLIGSAKDNRSARRRGVYRNCDGQVIFVTGMITRFSIMEILESFENHGSDKKAFPPDAGFSIWAIFHIFIPTYPRSP